MCSLDYDLVKAITARRLRAGNPPDVMQQSRHFSPQPVPKVLRDCNFQLRATSIHAPARAGELGFTLTRGFLSERVNTKG